jgi:hypothetical protein
MNVWDSTVVPLFSARRGEGGEAASVYSHPNGFILAEFESESGRYVKKKRQTAGVPIAVR